MALVALAVLSLSGCPGSPSLQFAQKTTVEAPLSISKAFGAPAINLGGVTSLTFTIANQASLPQSSVSFQDNLPAGLTVAPGSAVTTTCQSGNVQASGSVISFSGGYLRESTSCTVTVMVTGTQTNPNIVNETEPIISDEGGFGNAATSNVSVAVPPITTLNFGAASAPVNGSVSFIVDVVNPPANGFSLGNVGFAIPWAQSVQPAASSLGTISVCGGTVTTTQSSVTAGGLSIPVGGHCGFTLPITASAPGTVSLTTGPVNSAQSGPGPNSNTALLNVTSGIQPLSISSSFNPPAINLNGISLFNIHAINSAFTPQTGVNFTFAVKFGLGFQDAQTTCGGNLTVTPGSITLAGGTVGANSSCDVNAHIQAGGVGTSITSIVGPITSNEGGASNTTTSILSVAVPPQVNIAFASQNVTENSTIALNYNILNPATNSFPLSGVTFSQSLPPSLQVDAAGLGASQVCGGTLTATTNSVQLNSVVIPQGGQCNFPVILDLINSGPQNLATGSVSSLQSGPGPVSNTASVTVKTAPLALGKIFAPPTVPINGITTLILIVGNNSRTTGQTNVSFTDFLPAGLVIAGNPMATNNCGGNLVAAAGSATISLSGGQVGPAKTNSAFGFPLNLTQTNCKITVQVIATQSGPITNTTSAVSSTEGGTGFQGSAVLNVIPLPPPPLSLSAQFSPSAINPNGTTNLLFQIANPATTGQTGVAFTSSLANGLVVGPGQSPVPNTCGGTLTAQPGSANISLSGGAIGPNSNCTLGVPIVGSVINTNITNTTSAITSNEGGTGNSASANLSVAAPPTVSLGFGAATAPLNTPIPLIYTITDPPANPFGLSVRLSDNLTGGLLAQTQGIVNNCGGTVAVTSGTLVSLTGGNVLQGGQCTFTVPVTGAIAGTVSNTVNIISSAQSGLGSPSNTATITIVAPPGIGSAFGTFLGGTLVGSTLPLNFTIVNPNTSTPLTQVGFTSPLTGGLAIAPSSGIANPTCGGTLSAAGGTISLAGATIAANSQCNFSVNVIPTIAGSVSNTAGVPSSLEGGTGAAGATAQLNVLLPLTIATAFNPTTITLNGSSTLTYTITNPPANTVAQPGVSFSDGFPFSGGNPAFQITSVASNTCGGTVTATPGSGFVSLFGATAAVNSSCSLAVNVTGVAAGTFQETTGPIGSLFGNGAPSNTSTLTINAPTGPFLIGGSVINLSGTTPGLQLQDNGGDTLTLNGNGPFTFATQISKGSPYSVTILTQPTSPMQTCSVAQASGTANADVTNIVVDCGHGEWTWMGGTNVINQSGVYGTQGTAAASNIPGAREGAVSWVSEPGGNFFLFGGLGDDFAGTLGYLNDMWSDGQWTWLTGPNIANQLGTYGIEGTAAAANIPGARGFSTISQDLSGNVLLFGGTGYDSAGTLGDLNDFWVFANGQWVWDSGSNTADQAGSYGTQGTAAPGNVPGSRASSVSWADPSLNFWLFGGMNSHSGGSTVYFNDLWEFAGAQWTWVSGSSTVNQSGSYVQQGAAVPGNQPGARAQAVSWSDLGGNLWLFGGMGFDSVGTNGPLNDLWVFTAGKWGWMSGANTVAQKGTYGTQGVAAPGNVPGARFNAIAWVDAFGNFWLFGGQGYDSAGNFGYLNDLWEFSALQWTWVAGSNLANQSGAYGTQGVTGPGVMPGGHSAGVTWIDAAGNLWFFGGFGNDSSGNAGHLNDLWKYEP